MKKVTSSFALLQIFLFTQGCLKTRAEVYGKESFQDNQRQVSSMQKASSFDSNTRLGEIEENLRLLIGKNEESQHRLQQLEERLSSQSNLDSHPIILELQKRNEHLIEELKVQRAQIDELKNKYELNNTSVKTPSVPVDSWAEAEELFLAKDYRRAILSYQRYREQNPKGSEWPEATYKIGLSFERLNMLDEAKSFYNEVIDKFPKSSGAQKAKVRVKKIK